MTPRQEETARPATDLVFRYTLKGGFVGHNEEMVIDATGHIVISIRGLGPLPSERHEFDLGPERLKAIESTLASLIVNNAHFGYPLWSVFDGIYYSFQYRDRVVTAGGKPDHIEDLLAFVSDLVEIGRRRSNSSPNSGKPGAELKQGN